MKKAIIIGASSGIGRELANILSKDNYILGLAARRDELLIQLQKELDTDSYVKHIDISKQDDAMKQLIKLINEMKDIDLIIITSGTGHINNELNWNKEKETIDVNVIGVTAMINISLKYFMTKNSGHCECILIAGNGDLNVKYYNGKFDAYQRTYILESKNKLYLHTKYLYYYMNKYIEILRKQSIGGVIKYIRIGNLTDIKIQVPPFETQENIAIILEKTEKALRSRREANRLLDVYLKSVFVEMFGDVRNNSYKLESKKLYDICEKIYGGGTPSKSCVEYFQGNIPWVTPKDMKCTIIYDSIDHITEDAIKNSSTNLVEPNSLLMVIRSGILKRYLPLAINKREVTINQDMKAFIVNNDIVNVYYLYYYFKLYQSVLLQNVRSVTADNIEFNIIKNLEVPIPLIKLQTEFACIVEKVEILKEKNKKSESELQNLFNSLRQNAFNSELKL